MRETLWSLFVSERFHWSVSTRLTTSSCTRSTARSASSSTPWTGALTTETVRLCVRGEELGRGGGGGGRAGIMGEGRGVTGIQHEGLW